jgi:hypothetical protein
LGDRHYDPVKKAFAIVFVFSKYCHDTSTSKQLCSPLETYKRYIFEEKEKR